VAEATLPRTAKNIVICCDGTGNEYGEHNTNVVRLFRTLEKQPERQIRYYDPGVGTFSAPAAVTITAKFTTRLLGLAFAYGITKNIEDAYEYLMDKYHPGDRVFLFGFSRGAFTVRALAGMLHSCGLLEKGSNNLIPYATKMYRNGERETAEGFKRTFSRQCKPHFVGVWDTVKSVGLLVPRRFPNARLNPDVQYGRHAVSIDEKRSKFRPNLWDEPAAAGQSIKQVWFAGVHSDVGGSYPESGLSDIALQWMLDEAVECGLLLDAEARAGIRPDPTGTLHNSLLPVWWLLGWRRRRIPNGSRVHQSVLERQQARDDYRPANLRTPDALHIEAWKSPR
jgi:uncharacterized protein (DUF2235 family)